MKQRRIVRLTESELKQVIEGTVKKIIREKAKTKKERQMERDWAKNDSYNEKRKQGLKTKADLNRNLNSLNDTGFAHAYANGDDIYKQKNLKGALKASKHNNVGNKYDDKKNLKGK